MSEVLYSQFCIKRPVICGISQNRWSFMAGIPYIVLKDTGYLRWKPNSALNIPMPLTPFEGPSSINRRQMGFSCLSDTFRPHYVYHWGKESLGVEYLRQLMPTSNNRIIHHLLRKKWTQVLQMTVIIRRVCINYWFKHITSMQSTMWDYIITYQAIYIR